MSDEDMDDAVLECARGQDLFDLLGDKMKSAWVRVQS
jgi:hypothetical protein